MEYDQSHDPFFGSGFKYIIKDSSDRHYIVFFEYTADSKRPSGKRAAIGNLTDLGSGGAVFVGTPYSGVSFNKELLSELKKLAKKDVLPNLGE